MTRLFEFEDKNIFDGLKDFCKGHLKEVKTEGASKILRVPCLFQNNAIGYFFVSHDVLVLTDTAQKIDQIISDNNIDDSLIKIREVSD